MPSFNFLKTDYQLKQLKNKFSTVWYAGKINGYWCFKEKFFHNWWLF